MGDVLGGFFVGYFWFQIPGGLAWQPDRGQARAGGVRPALGGGDGLVGRWRGRSRPLYWSRIALGAAQAGLFAVTIMALRDWFPASRQGTGQRDDHRRACRSGPSSRTV